MFLTILWNYLSSISQSHSVVLTAPIFHQVPTDCDPVQSNSSLNLRSVISFSSFVKGWILAKYVRFHEIQSFLPCLHIWPHLIAFSLYCASEIVNPLKFFLWVLLWFIVLLHRLWSLFDTSHLIWNLSPWKC